MTDCEQFEGRSVSAEAGETLPRRINELTYRQRLNHWAIVRLLPDMQHIVVARFRRRSDADGHLHFLQQIPNSNFIVIFNVGSEF
jgi:hypothetical protein